MFQFLLKKVREAVRYTRNSPTRLRKFKELFNLDNIKSKVASSLDVPTKWNSSYLMLKTLYIYMKRFLINMRRMNLPLGQI